MQRLERAVELGLAVVVRIVRAEHADEHLLEEGRLAVRGDDVLAQVARLDVEARELGAVTDDLEVAAVDQFAILGAANDAYEVVVGQLPQKRDVDAQDIGDVLDEMELLAGLLGGDLHGGIGEQADLERERGEVGGAVKLLLDGRERHVPRFLQMQNDLKPIDVRFGVLTVALGRAVRRYEPLVLEEANLGV